VSDLTEDVYRKLARKLDAIPNGFPQTESGVELKLLAKMYTVEEAALASEMRLTPETPEVIAQRTGRDPVATKSLLKIMVERGLIRGKREGEKRKFGLMPFVVGVYESQLERFDEEEALLFEEYYETFAKEVLSMTPSLHVVIPVEKSIPFEVQVFPYEQASQLLERSKSFGVRKCICRVQRSLVGKPCKHSVENCLVFAPFEGAFQGASDIRVLTKDEAFKILRETEEEGLIHSSANVREGQTYICNCCTCCCGIMRGISQFGIENSVAKSDFFAAVNPELCTGCGTCSKRCQFGAPMLTDDVSHVNQKRCVGCGLCVVSCPSQALSLVRKPEIEKHIPARNEAEWRTERAKNRGISLQDIL
jgi:electron transport complex protein RnfB